MKLKVLFLGLLVSALAVSCNEKPQPEPEPEPLPEDEYVNLSKQGTANAYMIPEAGKYSFDATVMGNGVSTRDAQASELNPASVEMLWQDAPGLIAAMELKEGRVLLETTGEKGNAVVAVRDVDGKILWNWHLWITKYDPMKDAEKMAFNGVAWMDRNLGAGDNWFDEAGEVKGLVYQWGRKDPFPAMDGWYDYNEYSIFNAAGESANDILKVEVVSEVNNLANAIANPTTFYGGVMGTGEGMGPYDWYTTDEYSNQNDYLWAVEGSGAKTMFDPCPPGWKVPDKMNFNTLNNNSFQWGDEIMGRTHEIMGYFPAAGIRGFEGGLWTAVSIIGDYWSSSAAEEGWVNILHFLPSMINTRGTTYRAAGAPVRCVSEAPYGDVPSPDAPAREMEFDRLVESAYLSNRGVDGSANYYIGLSDVEVTADEQGQMVPAEPGNIIYLDIYADNSEDPANAMLPEGTYEIGSQDKKGLMTTDYTWIRYSEEDGSIQYIFFKGGNMTVTYADGKYLLDGNFITMEDTKLHFTYSGAIGFTNRNEDIPETNISEPVNATFTSVDAVWEHRSMAEPHYDRFSVDLWAGEMVDGVVLVDGYTLHIDLLSPASSTKDNIQITPGVYEVSDNYEPNTFYRGQLINMMGVPMYVGTYFREVRPTNTSVLYGLATSGTIEVKREGDNYEFIVNLVSAEGVVMNGTYSMGEVSFVDNSPLMPGGDWYSILYADKELIFNENDDVYAYGYNYADRYYANTSYFEVVVNNHTTNESFYLDFLAEKGATSPVGTYTAAADPENPKAGEFIPGYMNLSIYEGTWAYMTFDDDNYEAGGAPATEGTLIISEGAKEGEYRIEFNVKDDADPKHTVTASWEGPISITYR